jgi:signal transduction histidine kinase
LPKEKCDVIEESAADELSSLRRTTREIVAISALSSVWSAYRPSQLADSLVETLVQGLRLEFAYLRLVGSETTIERAYASGPSLPDADVVLLGDKIRAWIKSETPRLCVPNPVGPGTVQVAITPLGPNFRDGALVTGARRATFPLDTERLIINVAINQARTTLQHKWAHERAEALRLRAEESERQLRLALERAELETQNVVFERNQLETIFKHSPAAMVLFTGSNFVFEEVNPHYQAIFPDRELKGRAFLEACPEFKDQPFLGLLQKVLETGEPFIGREILARHPSSRLGPLENHYYDFTYMRVTDTTGTPYGVYVHAIDVTARVVDRLALEASQASILATVSELEQERDLRTKFVAALTHDLRTPLSAAKMSAQLLALKHGDPLQVQRLSARISDNMDRADLMIRDLLDVTVIKAGEALPVTCEECDLAEIARAVIADLASLHGDRFELRSGAVVPGFWDAGSLRRAIENLVLNAVKYGAASTPITVRIDEWDDRVCLGVHNLGNPISPDDQGSLFQLFKRSRSAVQGGQRGWGIGLTLVQGIVAAHGGDSSVVSAPNEGTTFKISLPRDARDPDRRRT